MAGSEDKIVSFSLGGSGEGGGLRLVTTRTVTNPGLGSARIRPGPDKRIVVAGGWDGRVRLFSWIRWEASL